MPITIPEMSITRHDHKDRVYVPSARPVKQPARKGPDRLLPGSILLWAAALMCATGCAIPSRSTGVLPYPVAMTYNAELAYLLFPDNALAIIQADLAQMRSLGFDTVALRHLARDRFEAVSTLAQDAGLQIAATPPSIHAFLRSGALPADCASVNQLVAKINLSYKMPLLLLGPLADAGSAQRADRIAQAWPRMTRPPVFLAWVVDPTAASALGPAVDLLAATLETVPLPRAGTVMLLDCRRDADMSLADAQPAWLADYHAGLAGGLTGGLIVQGYRAVSSLRRGLVQREDRGGYDLSTGLRRLTDRARQWGPRLRRSQPSPLKSVTSLDPALQLVLFAGAKRRLVLMHNTATDRYLRGQARLAPDSLGTPPVLRAVQVPPDPQQVAGQVIPTGTASLNLPFELAPGDAILWELF